MNGLLKITRKVTRTSGICSGLRIVVFLVFQLHFISHSAVAQDVHPDSLMIFRFLKTDTELQEPGTYFNVLEIVNNDSKSISGIVKIGGPDNWHFIGPNSDSLTLQPGASRLIPVRVSIPRNTLGGISYLIGAEFFGKDLYNYANSYLSILRKSRWDMRLSSSEVYISDFRPHGEVSLSIENTGNSNELIKLSFEMGGLLEFREEFEADSFLYVEVPAHKDTSLVLGIRRKQDLSYAAEQTFKHNWRASSLNIEASTPDQSLYGSVRATALESKNINRLPILNTPLNAEITLYNLLSQQKKKMSTRVFGKVLFPEDQQLTYSLGYYNLYFDSRMNQDIDIYQQLRYMIRYNDPRSEVWLGDRIGVGMLHTLTGRGIRAYHDLNNNGRVSVNVVQNPYARNIGGFAGYQGVIGSAYWNTGLTLETTTDQSFSHYSVHLGGSYKLKQKHTFDLQTATSLSKYGVSNYLENDTTLLGFSYKALYRYRGNRLLINAENTNTLFSYTRNAGINRTYLTGSYKFKDDLLLKARYYRTRYASTKYPYNFYNPANTNINENARLLLSYNRGKIIYQGGPQYFGTVRYQYYPTGDYSTRYANFQPGMIGIVSFRLGNRRSISPNASFNTMYYNYDVYDPDEEKPEYDNSWTYTVGINYYDQAFKLNAYYSTGEATDVYRNVVINDHSDINQAIHIRPYYERYFLKETIRLSAFLNYSYYMPSQRENMLFNLTGNIIVRNTWNFFGSFNVYRVSRNDLDVGRVTSRNVNMMVGIRKAFNIQQPRLAFFDLTIVGFNDLDGDGIKDENEKPISNVLVKISRDANKNVESRTGFAEISMITDPQGEIYYQNIPEGVYDLSIVPLLNLEDLFFLHGEHQTIAINEELTYFLPLVESYKIRGRIIIDRDPSSNEGNISSEGIRITAVSDQGDTYSTLSNSFGTYVLDLPKANAYEVNIYNVFGENFQLERGTYKVQFTDNKTINLDFKFTERRRAIQFKEGEQFFQFNLDDRDNQQ